jgi:hypothetical protein
MHCPVTTQLIYVTLLLQVMTAQPLICYNVACRGYVGFWTAAQEAKVASKPKRLLTTACNCDFVIVWQYIGLSVANECLDLLFCYCFCYTVIHDLVTILTQHSIIRL